MCVKISVRRPTTKTITAIVVLLHRHLTIIIRKGTILKPHSLWLTGIRWRSDVGMCMVDCVLPVYGALLVYGSLPWIVKLWSIAPFYCASPPSVVWISSVLLHPSQRCRYSRQLDLSGVLFSFGVNWNCSSRFQLRSQLNVHLLSSFAILTPQENNRLKQFLRLFHQHHRQKWEYLPS